MSKIFNALFGALLSLVLAFGVLSLTACLGFCTDGLCLAYDETVVHDGFQLEVNNSAGNCIAGNYMNTVYDGRNPITIPDEYNGMPVTRLGGYVGTGVPVPFHIRFSQVEPHGALCVPLYDFEAQNCIDTGCEFTELPITLNIGKNVSEIVLVNIPEFYRMTTDDGEQIYYRVSVCVNCSAENEYFHAEDGRLYNSVTGELVEGFPYAQ